MHFQWTAFVAAVIPERKQEKRCKGDANQGYAANRGSHEVAETYENEIGTLIANRGEVASAESRV